MYLLRVLIGSWRCLHLLWLVKVVSFVFVLRHSFENSFTRCNKSRFKRPSFHVPYRIIRFSSLQVMQSSKPVLSCRGRRWRAAMIGMDSRVPIHSEIVLVTICTRTSVKIASELPFTFVAVDGPSTATFLFRRCSTVVTIIATDVYVIVVATKIRPGSKDILAF